MQKERLPDRQIIKEVKRNQGKKIFQKFAILCTGILLTVLWSSRVQAASVPQAETPNYKVVFFAHENYYEQDADGSKSGYGHEMMQNGSRYMQCTFSCVGYDKNIFPSRSILKILREL